MSEDIPPKEAPTPPKPSPSPPPRPQAKKAAPPPPTPRRKPTAAQLQGKLEDTFSGIALALMAAGDEHCATIMATQAKPLAEAWARLAARNPRVEQILTTLTSGGAYAEVVTVTLATALPIAAHHSPVLRDRLVAFPFGGMVQPEEPAPEPAASDNGSTPS